MKYYLYKITNLVNERIYVGVHKTINENDGYMGSGKILKAAIRKYGIENFKKDVLEEFDTAAAMFAREAEIVNQAFVDRPDVYNIKCGGQGGFDHINNNVALRQAKNKKARAATNAAMSSLHGEDWRSWLGKRAAAAAVTSPNRRNVFRERPDIQQKGNSPESRLKAAESIKRTIKERQLRKGSKNSQYGSFWITDGANNKKCRGDIPEGWYRGRRMSKSNKC